MRLSCPGDCGQWTVESYDEESGEATLTEPRRCWVTNDATEAFDDMGVWDALESLDIDEIRGPIFVRVWNEGSPEECYPKIERWTGSEPTTVEQGEDIEYEDPCPHCGGEPGDTSLHTDDCPTLGTCAQCEPSLSQPWHRDEEWWDGKTHYSVAFNNHVAEAHTDA